MAHGSAHDRLGRTARLVLLLATLVGLAAMHTLGHDGPHLTTPAHTGHMATAAHDAPVLDGPANGHHGMSGWDVCLAVLVAFAVLLLAAALLHGRRAAGAAHLTGRTARTGPRAPPPRRVGLTLATVSVLRT
ncbi:DUF6153 family protein [Dactylosporangium darangshiense]|uniref:DUF6153 family protein n=1 Tax=Dactylosporangium darangshiense TaxID=579108 RepID=UPI0031EE79BF